MAGWSGRTVWAWRRTIYLRNQGIERIWPAASMVVHTSSPTLKPTYQGDMNQMATSPNSTGKIGNFITPEASF